MEAPALFRGRPPGVWGGEMNQLVRYDAACKALTEAKAVDEVLDIRNQGEGLRAYARQAKNKTLEADAWEIRMRAERRVGELMRTQDETVGLSEGGRPRKTTGFNSDPVKPTLAEAGIDQVRLIMDVGAAREVFARRQGLGEDIIGAAHALKIHALARLGALLKEIPKASGTKREKGTRGVKGRISSTTVVPLLETPTLADLGLTRKIAAAAQQLDDLPPETREAIAQRETTFAQARRKTKAAEVRRVVSLPDASRCASPRSLSVGLPRGKRGRGGSKGVSRCYPGVTPYTKTGSSGGGTCLFTQ
jgi:hypothetical protein